MVLNDLDKNITIVTSTYVMHERMPILYISNDDDGEGGFVWQFHCDNGDYRMEKMLLVRLETVLNIDPGLTKISLNIGEEARRKDINSQWNISKQ